MGAIANGRSAALVTEYVKREGITQAELARRAGVSQATVSRALRRQPIRHGRQRLRLFTFIQQSEGVSGARRVELAFRRIWDGTDAHAAALARIIAACEGLEPRRVTPTDA
jgi:transcriptional regulator with XRE-family HTH domain